MFELPDNGPEGYKELVYSFDYENSHFVILDSNVAGDEYGRITGGQLSWLFKDLKNTKKEHIFVFFHEPAYPVGPHIGSSLDVDLAKGDIFWEVLSRNRVLAVFNGHECLYRRSIHKGVYQIINGTSGAPIYKGRGGEFYNYAVVDIDDERIQVTIKDEFGKERDKFLLWKK